MKHIVECVPNFSEGRRPEVVDAIVSAITSVNNVYLLGREMDADHNRAVDLLEASGKDGKDASKHLARLMPLKTKVEYDPETVPRSKAETAVKSAGRLVEIAKRLIII